MGREVLPEVSNKDIAFILRILEKGDIKHKNAIRLRTILNRVQGKSTTDTAAALGLNPVTVSRHVRRHNEGGVEALLRDKTRKPGKEPIPTGT
jgi:DNA-binding transcriptional ArsR family regulator